MVWFFGRGNEVLEVQTRFDAVAGEYVLEMIRPNGPPETERFRDVLAFEVRVKAVEEQLKADSWTQIGGPEIKSDGWRGPIPH
jgi:hypothetical protein